MLDMGFLDDIETILSALPKERQTGALLGHPAAPDHRPGAEVPARSGDDPGRAGAGDGRRRSRSRSTRSRQRAKLEALMRILDLDDPTSAMIFCRTKLEVDELTQALQGRGYAPRRCTATSRSRCATGSWAASGLAPRRCWSRPTSPLAGWMSSTSATSSTTPAGGSRSLRPPHRPAPGAPGGAARRSRW